MWPQILCVLIASSATSVAATLTELTFTSNVDHNAQAPVSFKLRYFIDKAQWETGGPILFYCGGWENIEEDTKNMVTPQLMAKELKAAVVFAEHRYYGKSLPFTDSFKNAGALKYLQVEQVLADYKALAVFLRNNLAVESKTRVPVIALGGGYSGILATRLRVTYPDVIDGAWASSAPIRGFHGYGIDVGAFDQSVREIYTGTKFTHTKCNSTIGDAFRTAFAAIDTFGKTSDGLAKLSKWFSLKPPLSSQADVVLMKEFIRAGLIGMVSANLPYQSNVKEPLAPFPVDNVCSKMSAVNGVKDKSHVDEVAVAFLVLITHFYYNNSGQVSSYCVKPNACPPSHDEVARRWQVCTQLPLWECPKGPPNDFFWPACTEDTFEATRKAQCKEQFGSTQFGWAESMFLLDYVSSTQQTAWNAGKDVPDIGNFIFTVPGIGPWWRSMLDGGIMHASKGIYHYLIEGVSANADLYQPMDCDSSILVDARNQIANILKCWSGQKGDYDCNPDALERVQPGYEKPDNTGAICKKATEPYSWEPQPNPTTAKAASWEPQPNPTTPKAAGRSSQSFVNVLTYDSANSSSINGR